MNTKDFYYDLPEDLIAQTPVYPRDSSRLLAYDIRNDITDHKHFRDIIDYLEPGDALVINETKVIPARLFGHKSITGAAVEILLLNRRSKDVWEALGKPGKRLRVGDVITFSPELDAVILEKKDEGILSLEFRYTSSSFEEILDRLGTMPLPPYIKEKLDDPSRYQTVYAKEEGSAAAPTAGLHFTPELLNEIREKGIDIVPVLLHVGLGTFRPVKTDTVEDHKMHSEFYSVSQDSADRINSARKNGHRIIATGTTCVRTLESASDDNGNIIPGSSNTQIFIYPGYRFKAVDAIITNFHLPESTLIMLVSAFAGREKTLDIYKTAVEMKYRFFSFGDACFFYNR
ncbi:MAG: tRNA preQ1(34) S-adenosylmethionine ribosyltransferase-isomerase QueA [Clostridia bacterium]|nr:tRNA preQ1(34) S-adenosylmethionine ribosyltransferase-isomerase QueA [Clostridia bacterium]